MENDGDIPAPRRFNQGMAWLVAVALALAPQEEPADEELEALLEAYEALSAEAMLDLLAGPPAWFEALQAALREAAPPRAPDVPSVRPAIADAPRVTLVPDPPPPPADVAVRRKKTARPDPPDATMAAALLLGGASITLVGLLLWTLRRTD